MDGRYVRWVAQFLVANFDSGRRAAPPQSLTTQARRSFTSVRPRDHGTVLPKISSIGIIIVAITGTMTPWSFWPSRADSLLLLPLLRRTAISSRADANSGGCAAAFLHVPANELQEIRGMTETFSFGLQEEMDRRSTKLKRLKPEE
ncbi:hypothetical protein ZHAS_00020711 [Anopheles sinensis]|uniref:Uncharacterized protein n=1 Tax=Anopheles sinensis TaxID=74873 RepID=A0A084WQH5_ANOSI|nr:hypothetical protein ZHAS_00020711 [Anopheles sinensis]